MSDLLQPDNVIETARRETGHDDFGGDAFREGLAVYCESLVGEAALNELGVAAVHTNLVRNLANRLRVVDWASRHPAVAEETMDAPLVIIGHFRAGTTLLSQLVDVDRRTRSLLSWEAQDSVPPPTPGDPGGGQRLEEARSRAALLDQLNPGLKAIHHEEPDGPTECITLLSQDFKALLWESIANVPRYGDWLFETDHRSAYDYHRRCLQLLQSGGVVGRWSLKSPHHALALDALTSVYPDARLVYLHRDPVVVVASACSLMRCLSGTFSDADHTDYIARRWTRVLTESVTRVDEFRARYPDHPVLDLHYADLVADPMAAVARVYDFAGMPPDERTEELMVAHLAANPRRRFGTHRYDLAGAGLREEELRERFAPYVERYAVAAEL